jgi:hypothetical protein
LQAREANVAPFLPPQTQRTPWLIAGQSISRGSAPEIFPNNSSPSPNRPKNVRQTYLFGQPVLILNALQKLLAPMSVERPPESHPWSFHAPKKNSRCRTSDYDADIKLL